MPILALLPLFSERRGYGKLRSRWLKTFQETVPVVALAAFFGFEGVGVDG